MKRLTNKRLIDLLDDIIDNKCEMEGVRETIAYLISLADLTKEELLELNFDENDINIVMEENHNEY